YLRKWLMIHCRVLAVVGFHPYAFLPYTGVKTAVLFLEKRRPYELESIDYSIAFTTSSEPGKDCSGRVSGKSDYDNIGLALLEFFVNENRPWANTDNMQSNISLDIVKASEVISYNRLDPEYYSHDVRTLYFDLHSKSHRRLGDIVSRTVKRFSRGYAKEIDYIDISSVDNRTGIVFPTRMDAAEAPSRATYIVQAMDILVSTVRPERNVVAFVTKTGDVPIIASNGFCLLRPKGIAPELIFAYCKTDAFRKLLARSATASMYPTVTDRDILEMPFIQPDIEEIDAVVAKMKEGLKMIEMARKSITQAVAKIETVIMRNGDHENNAQVNMPGLFDIL
ncbi:MAG: hypothetical protein AB1478_11910, partial [Nitrospirota bacterium]